MGEIAVTGASGFIGRRLVRHLIGRGETPVALSRHPVDVGTARQVLVDDYADVASLTRQLNGVDALVHQGELPVALLGMSFLNRMEMQRDGSTMTLKKRF